MRLIVCFIGAFLVQVVKARHQRVGVERGLRTMECAAKSEALAYIGYSCVSSFVEDYLEGKSSTFKMCPDGAFDEPLSLDSSFQQEKITIECADPNAVCLWKIKEGSHLKLENVDFDSLIVSGISFKGATNSSIRIKSNSRKRLMSFRACDWSENSGDAVINAIEDEVNRDFLNILSNISDITVDNAYADNETYVLGGLFSNEPPESQELNETNVLGDIFLDKPSEGQEINDTYVLGGLFSNQPPESQDPSTSELTGQKPEGRSTKIELNNCLFDRNIVNKSIVSIGSIDIEVDGCEFIGNEASESLIHLRDEGLHDIYNVRFKDNRLLGEVPGIIFVSASSRFNSRDICGSNNQIIQNEMCNGTVQQVPNTDECGALDDSGCTTECIPFDRCDECVASTEGLRTLVENGDGAKLCENSIFDMDVLDEPLLIGVPALSLECKFNCTIKGGNQQLRILDGASDVSISGINFESSRDVSIKIEIDHTEPANIKIKNCQFKGHTGSNIIKLSSTEGDGDGDPIMARVEIQSSSLVDNTGQNYLIENEGLDLSIDSCKFWGNDNPGIIGALGGRTVIRDSQSGDNNLTQGLFYVNGDGTSLIVTGICSVDDLFQANCDGIFNATCNEHKDTSVTSCDSSCEPVMKNNCSIPDCLSDYRELQLAMAITPGDIYIICPDTTINLDNSDDGFAITEPQTKIKCGKNGRHEDNCVIKGGSHHFVINTTNVGVYGMTFIGAQTTSIEIYPDTGETSSFSFEDCSWESNVGFTTFAVKDTESTKEENENSVVNVSNSTFLMNNAEGSIISNAGSSLTISKSLFTQNSALVGSLIEIESNIATISDVEFVDNAVGKGIIFVSSNAELMESRICGFENEATVDSCDGIIKLADSSLCANDECKRSCTSLMPCQVPQCFNDWKELLRRMDKSAGGESFVLCPKSRFLLEDANRPLYINENDIVVRCGPDGKHDNECSIIGGELQVIINGTASGVRFEGVTFSNSTDTSIAALGGSEASATFDGCEFSGHSGSAVIEISHSRHALIEPFSIEKPADVAMEVNFHSCYFNGNTVDFSPLVNIGGKVKVSETIFDSNMGSKGSGAITSMFHSSLSITSSCFLKNRGNSYGALLLVHDEFDSFSTDENFGEGNSISVGDCTSIALTEPSGVLTSCDKFDSVGCLAPSLDHSGDFGDTPPPSPGMSENAPTSVPCYGEDALDALYEKLRNSKGNEVFTLCEGLTIDMDKNGQQPLIVQESGITIECAVPSTCFLSGGNSHIVLTGSIENIAIRGLTMTNALKKSIDGTLQKPSSIKFELCDWRDNKGTTVVSINAEEEQRRRMNQNLEYENLVSWHGCNFEENISSEAIIKAEEISLILDAVVFEKNAIAENVVNIDDGFLFLLDSCFIDSGSASALINAEGSNADIENIYLSGNDDSACLGYLNENGDCDSLSSTSSCFAEKKRCISRWSDLIDTIPKILVENEETTFTVCPNAVLDVSKSDPIEIKTSKTTIRCGNNGASTGNCVIKGGEIQFKIVDSPTDVVFSGITFTEASVAAINAAGDVNARASVIDCIFKDMKGAHAALLIYSGEVPSWQIDGRQVSIEDFSETEERSMTLDVEYSLFLANEVNLAPIANLKGSLDVSSCKFNSNNGTTIAGGIMEWYSGIMLIQKTCFTNNYGMLAGSIYVNGESTSEEENFSKDNEASHGECNDGLFLAAAEQYDGGPRGLCAPMLGSSCGTEITPTVLPTVAPTLPKRPTTPIPPSFPPMKCIQSWSELSSELNASIVEGNENKFILCPNISFLPGEDAIVLNPSTEGTKISIECPGETGETCLIQGGRRHFHILGKDVTVLFRGIKFEGSEEVSILAAADGGSSLRFKGCEWTANKGSSAILIYNGNVSNYNLESLQNDVESMEVQIDSCSFTSNNVTTGVIINVGGRVLSTTSAFKSNQDTSMGCIQCKGKESRLRLINNCFIENDSNMPGAVFLSNGAEMLLNEGNFGYDNRVPAKLTTCADIFSLAPGEECNKITCPGACSTFDAERCDAPGFNYPPISLAPTGIGNANGQLSGSSNIELKETSLFTSLFFLRNIAIALLTIFFGICAFFSCNKTHYGKDKKQNKSNESNPTSSKTESISSKDTNGVVLNVDEQVAAEQEKGSKGGFFARRKTKKKLKSNEDESGENNFGKVDSGEVNFGEVNAGEVDSQPLIDAECVPFSESETFDSIGGVAENPMELS
mmetsp:Transcript_21433/g.32391  ORF Transcript_21433/g.32391 Transcript_21433/m.32391 type:complete len:2216 (+) Transcript_21433:145-6792(+)